MNPTCKHFSSKRLSREFSMHIIPEKNVIKKDWRKIDLKIALCYPNVYRAGMTGLTVQLLYALFNSRDDVACERFFLPTRNEPLASLESHQPIKKFDVLAFTFQYEEDYFNALKILLNADVKVKKETRNLIPLIVAGGPCVTENPFPLRDFIDIFLIGEVEPVRDEFIEELKKSIRDKTVENFRNKHGYFIEDSAERVYVKRLDNASHPLAQIVPNVESSSPYMPSWNKTFTVEAVRGCPNSCKFCLIRQISTPKRERSLGKLKEIISEGVKFTGVSKVSIIGAGIAYYSKLEELCEYVVDDLKLQISIPSLDSEILTERLIKILVKGGERTIALAPETGSEKLRRSLGKKANNDQILDAAKTALDHGIKNLKLYYMIGLPDESIEDLQATVQLSKKIANLGFGRRSIRLSVNPLIPKPHTPFHSYGIKTAEYLKSAVFEIRRALKSERRIHVESLNLKHAEIQAILSNGGPELADFILYASTFGGGLSGWYKALSIKRENFETLMSKSERDKYWLNIKVK